VNNNLEGINLKYKREKDNRVKLKYPRSFITWDILRNLSGSSSRLKKPSSRLFYNLGYFKGKTYKEPERKNNKKGKRKSKSIGRKKWLRRKKDERRKRKVTK